MDRIGMGGCKKKIVSAVGCRACGAIEPHGSEHLNKICIFTKTLRYGIR